MKDEAFDPGPPPSIDLAVSLGPEQIEQFHRDGFTSVERITTDEELAWLEPIYDELVGSRGSFKGGYFDLSRKYDSDGVDLVPQVLMPEVRFPQLLSTTAARNAKTIAAQLLQVSREDLRAWSHMILKPAVIGGELPWHQDEAYWDETKEYRALGCWIPLDPATADSGCMTFLPGSHLGEVRPHRHLNDDPEVHGLVVRDLEALDESAAVAVPLAPGGATFHHCRTLHRTPPNVSDRVRRAWATELQTEPIPVSADERRGPAVGARRHGGVGAARRLQELIAMEYRQLGDSGLEVSTISLGSWLTYGGAVDAERAQACVRRALDLGVNLIDTANAYATGGAESFLGDLLARCAAR